MRIVLLEAVKAHHVDEMQRPLARLGARAALAFEAIRDIAEHRAPGQQGRVLKHHSPVWAGRGHKTPIHDDLARRWAQQAIDEAHLRADTDPQQLVFEMYGLVLALHHDARFIRRPGSVERAQAGFARLIDSVRASGTSNVFVKKHPKPDVKTLA